MNPHFGPGPLDHPEPTPDGLARAFRAADRRRLRTAVLAAVVPVIVSFSFAMPFRPDDRAGLEPAQRGGVPMVAATSTPSASATRPPVVGADVPRGNVSGPGGSPSPSALPSRADSGDGAHPVPDDARALVLTGDGTSSADFTIDETFTLAMDTFDVTGGGGPDAAYGFYIESRDRSIRTGAVHLPGHAGWLQFWSTDIPAGLTPGTYRAWLIGTGRTTISVRFSERHRGTTVRTSRPAETLLRTQSAADGEAVRFALLSRPTNAVTMTVAQVSDAPPVGSFQLCATLREEPCRSGDPQMTARYDMDGGEDTFWRPFWLEPRTRRDITATPDNADLRSDVTAVCFALYL